MYYSTIKELDIADGPGVRVTLFVSGCTNHCEGCFQPQTWDFCYGQEFTRETEEQILSLLSPAYVQGLTLLGGEPMEPRNQEAVLGLIRRVRSAYPKKNIWLFSGFTFEEMMDPDGYPHTPFTHELLSLLDVMVDGRFVLAKKDLMLRFRGSSNQRLLDMPRTLSEGKAVWWTDPNEVRRGQNEH